MSSFTTPLIYEWLDNGKWEITEAFTYDRGRLGSGDAITVPIKFQTDGASVPRALWWLFPPMGKYGKAAVLHDYCYTIQEYTRMESDDILIEAMDALKVNWLTQSVIYRAVRMFGWFSWNHHKKENEKNANKSH